MQATCINDLPPVLSVQQVQEFLGISKNIAYSLLHSRALPAIRIGRIFRITRDSLERFLDAGRE